MKRGALRRSSPEKIREWSDRSRKRLPAKSLRRLDEADDRLVVVLAALERDGHRCRAAELVPEVRCWGPLDPHEIIPRSAWRAGYLVLANVITVCRGHHDWIGDEPDLAHDRGLHGYSHEREA